MNLTDEVNKQNVQNIRYLIEQKKAYKTFFATVNDTSAVLTDMDHFPYKRFFRGEFESDRPIVFEREAGWRPTENKCYKVQDPVRTINNNKMCFEAACSTVYPCYPSYAAKYSDRDAFLVQLNNACVIEYR